MASTVEDFNEIITQRTGTLVWGLPQKSEEHKNDAEFQREKERFVELLLLLYSVAATLSKQVDSLQEVAQVWDLMASVCDNALTQLDGVEGADDVKDRILDIKNRCMKLRDLHS